MAEELTGGITYEVYDGDEDVFIPTERILEFVLTPTPQEETPYLFQPSISYVPYVTPRATKRVAVVNIETTGISPHDSQIVCISASDARYPDDDSIIFFNLNLENEEEMMRQFIAWFDSLDFNLFVGFNADFDYRWLVVLLMKYRLQSSAFFKCEVLDMMDYLKKGKNSYVPTMNKVNSLDSWETTLFGTETGITTDEYFAALADEDWQYIIDHNRRNTVITMHLYLLAVYCSGKEDLY